MLWARLCGSHACVHGLAYWTSLCWELPVCLVLGAENTAMNKRQNSCSQGCQSLSVPTGQCLHWAGYSQRR